MAMLVPVNEDEGSARGASDRQGGDSGDALMALRAALASVSAEGATPTAPQDDLSAPRPMAVHGPATTGLGDRADALLHGDNGLLALREQAARAALPRVEQALGTAYRAALAGIGDDRQQAQAAPMLRQRLEAALATARAHAVLQDAVAQAVADRAPPARSRAAALANALDPDLFDLHLGNGSEALRREGVAAGKAPAVVAQEASDYRSGIVRDHLDTLGMRDPVHAAADYARLRDGISPAARAQIEAGLAPSMADHRAIADVDAAARAGATTAPPTPQLDPRVLLGKMQVIAPTTAAAALPGLVERYGGDAAQAWAAAQLGTKAVDGLIAQQGDGWYAALPEDKRQLIEHHMALLGAPGSVRDAPGDVAGAATRIAAQDWPGDRKAAATRELLYRDHRAGQRRRNAESAASDQAYAMAEKLGTDFTSLAQIDPATRRLLPADVVADLARLADANVHPQGMAAQWLVPAAAVSGANLPADAHDDVGATDVIDQGDVGVGGLSPGPTRSNDDTDRRVNLMVRDIEENFGKPKAIAPTVNLQGTIERRSPLGHAFAMAIGRNERGPNGKPYSDGRYDPSGAHLWRSGRPHFGDDMKGAVSDPVYAAASGIVIKVDTYLAPVKDKKTKKPLLDRNGKPVMEIAGWGNYIAIMTPDGYVQLYGHLSRSVLAKFKAGQQVRVGEQLGEIGNSGNAKDSGDHLHFEVRKSNGSATLARGSLYQGATVDPQAWLAGTLPNVRVTHMTDTPYLPLNAARPRAKKRPPKSSR